MLSGRRDVDLGGLRFLQENVFTWETRVIEGAAPVYYTLGADRKGIHGNVLVCWELYGPRETDYRFLTHRGLEEKIVRDGRASTVELTFRIAGPGRYRLRAATADLAGRTAVAWKEFAAGE